MYALFADGNLVQLFSSDTALHDYARDNPGIYATHYVASLDGLNALLNRERERHETVSAIMSAGRLATYQFLYADK